MDALPAILAHTMAGPTVMITTLIFALIIWNLEE